LVINSNKITEDNSILIDKRTQLNFSINVLKGLINSRYGIEDNYPTKEQVLILYDTIKELRKQLRDLL